VNENIRSLLVLCVVNVTGFCLLSRNCDFSVHSSLCSEKTMLFVVGGLFIKIYILLTEYDTIVNTLWTGDENSRLWRFFFTTLKDRWRKFAF
jgi:hypothetical protein